MSKAIEDVKKIAFNIELNGIRCFGDEFRNIIKELERLDKYEEVLSKGRLIQDEIYEEYNTNGGNCYGVKRIHNNATIKLGKLEDIYEEAHKDD